MIFGYWGAEWVCEWDLLEYGVNQDHVRHLKKQGDQKQARRWKVGMDSYIWDARGNGRSLGHQMGWTRAKISIGDRWSKWIAEMCIDFPTIHVYGISIHNLTPCCPPFLCCCHIGCVCCCELYLVPKNHRTVTHKCFSIPTTPTSSSSLVFASLNG